MGSGFDAEAHYGDSCKGQNAPSPRFHAGWIRRVMIIVIVVATIAICASLVLYSLWEGVVTALIIFIVSLSAFSLIAAISYDAVIYWRLVDAFWVCSSFAAIVVALINIEQAAVRQQVSNIHAEIADLFSGLQFTVQSIATNDCEASPAPWDMRPRSPEPYKGACDRLMHLIPEMSYQHDQFSRTNKIAILKTGAQACVTGATSGSWGNLNERANSSYKWLIVLVRASKRIKSRTLFTG